MSIVPTAGPVRTARTAIRQTAAVSALLFAGTLGGSANASLFNISAAYSYFGARSIAMAGGTSFSAYYSSFVNQASNFAPSQSVTSSQWPDPSGGNISMVRSALSAAGFDLSFTQNTSGVNSWGGRITLTFTVTANTSVQLSGWLMGFGWSEQDFVKLRNVTDNQTLFEVVNRANFLAPVGTVQQFNTTQSLVVGKTYSLDWRTETVQDSSGSGANQNPLAGFTPLNFGVATTPVPGAGLASLGTLGLAGLARRRRR